MAFDNDDRTIVYPVGIIALMVITPSCTARGRCMFKREIKGYQLLSDKVKVMIAVKDSLVNFVLTRAIVTIEI